MDPSMMFDPFEIFQAVQADPQTLGPMMDQIGFTQPFIQQAMAANGGPGVSNIPWPAGIAGGSNTPSLMGGGQSDDLNNPSASRFGGIGQLAAPAGLPSGEPPAGPGEGTRAGGGGVPVQAGPGNPIPDSMTGLPGGMTPVPGLTVAPPVPVASQIAAGGPAAAPPNAQPAAGMDPRLQAQRGLAGQAPSAPRRPTAPTPPPMHGGVTGGVKTPEAKQVKPGSNAVQMLLAALQSKPVPALGMFSRGIA